MGCRGAMKALLYSEVCFHNLVLNSEGAKLVGYNSDVPALSTFDLSAGGHFCGYKVNGAAGAVVFTEGACGGVSRGEGDGTFERGEGGGDTAVVVGAD